MDLKISQLSEYNDVQGFYTVCVQDGSTVKYNLGTLASRVDGIVNACGIEEFDPTKAYQVGDFCLYNGNAYKFNYAHPAGAWNSGQVTQTTAIDEILALNEAEDRQKTTFKVTSDDPNLDLSGKIITINIEGETNSRSVTTDAQGEAVAYIPRDKTFSATLGALSGYTTSATLISTTSSTESTLNFRYYKDTYSRTFNIYATVSGTGADINDLVGGTVSYFLDDYKTFGTATLSIDPTNSSRVLAEVTWNESTAQSGTILYPIVTGYSFGQDITTTVTFQASDPSTTLEYIKD